MVDDFGDGWNGNTLAINNDSVLDRFLVGTSSSCRSSFIFIYIYIVVICRYFSFYKC